MSNIGSFWDLCDPNCLNMNPFLPLPEEDTSLDKERLELAVVAEELARAKEEKKKGEEEEEDEEDGDDDDYVIVALHKNDDDEDFEVVALP